MANANTIVVDPAGGPGVERSIGAAIARAADGDTIIVHSGTYNEDVHVDKRITLTGMDTGGGRPVVDGSRLAYLFDITITASNATVQGFDIRNGSLGIVIGNQYDLSVTGITVCDNRVSGTRGNAISIDYSNGNNITGNTLSRSVRGIVIGAHNNTISGNEIFDMRETGIMVSLTGNLIIGNVVHDCGEAGIEILGPANSASGNSVRDCKIGIFTAGSGNRVEGNTVYGNDEGIRLQQAYDGRITGNMVYENVCGLRVLTTGDNTIANNTFRDNTGEAINDDDTLGFNNISSNIGVTLPPFRYYADGSPYIMPSTPVGHGATVYVGGPEGQGTGNDPHQIATVVWPAPPDRQMVYVNLYSSPKKMSATNPGTGWGMLTYGTAKAWGCVSV